MLATLRHVDCSSQNSAASMTDWGILGVKSPDILKLWRLGNIGFIKVLGRESADKVLVLPHPQKVICNFGSVAFPHNNFKDCYEGEKIGHVLCLAVHNCQIKKKNKLKVADFSILTPFLLPIMN